MDKAIRGWAGLKPKFLVLELGLDINFGHV